MQHVCGQAYMYTCVLMPHKKVPSLNDFSECGLGQRMACHWLSALLHRSPAALMAFVSCQRRPHQAKLIHPSLRLCWPELPDFANCQLSRLAPFQVMHEKHAHMRKKPPK